MGWPEAAVLIVAIAGVTAILLTMMVLMVGDR